MKNKILAIILILVCKVGFGFTPPVYNWNQGFINPWGEKEISKMQTTNGDKSIAVSGFISEWITQAVLVSTNASNQRLNISIDAPVSIKSKIQIRVAGQIEDKTNKIIYDPLFTPDQIRKNNKYVLNGQNIANFPSVVVDKRSPVLVWITIDCRNVKAGSYKINVISKDANNTQQSSEMQLTVYNKSLPNTKDFSVFAWQNASNQAEIVDMLEHGINVFYRGQSLAWKNGASFLIYQLPTFSRPGLNDNTKQLIKNSINQIKKETSALGVPQNKWAVYVADEVSDGTVNSDVGMASYIHSLDPKIQVYFNPSTNATYGNTFNKIMPQASVIQGQYETFNDTRVHALITKPGMNVWYYTIPILHAGNIGTSTIRICAVLAFVSHFSGFGFYALNEWNGSPWQIKNKDNYSLVFPDLVTSVGYEALRQGIQDYRKFKVLSSILPQTKINYYTDLYFKTADYDAIKRQSNEINTVIANGK